MFLDCSTIEITVQLMQVLLDSSEEGLKIPRELIIEGLYSSHP